ncbi:MAG: hypothetical protein LWY06_06760 [Firmicutes bacterium]|nr:hypothetical protein [Bacillota bacterium]
MMKKQQNPVKSKGFTIVELITTTFILLLLTLNLFWMITAGISTWHISVTRTANHQNLRLTMNKISLDMKDSNVGVFTNNTSTSPQAFSFLSAVDSNGMFKTGTDGKPVWQKYVIYYIPTGTKNLVRKEVFGTFTTALTTSQLTTYCDGNGKLIAPNVTGINATPNVSNDSVSFTLTVSDTNKNGKSDTQSMNETVYLRN